MEFDFYRIVDDVDSYLDASRAENDLVTLGIEILREQIEDALDELARTYPPEVELPDVDDVLPEVQSEWFKDLNL